MPRHSSSNGATAIGGVSSVLQPLDFGRLDLADEPDRDVQRRGLTHTTFGGVFAASSLPVSALTTRVTSRRTASPTSTATNTLHLATFEQDSARSMSIAQFADIALTISRPPGKRNVRTCDALAAVDGDAHRADRLLLGAAAGPGNAGDADADVDAGALANACGHRQRDRLADRAVLRDQRSAARRAARSSRDCCRPRRCARRSPSCRECPSSATSPGRRCTTPRTRPTSRARAADRRPPLRAPRRRC